MKIAVVVPCHIPPSPAWIEALDAEARAHNAKVIIVDDSDGQLGELPKKWDVYGYDKQKKFLGELYEDFALLFHKSTACRVFGNIVAYKNGNDIIIGLDSDCIVPTHFIRDHIQFIRTDYGSGWFNPIGYPDYSRGYPYSQRHWKVVANMGLWKNVLDINGKDRKEGEPTEIRLVGSTVPNGYFPFSGMNFALAREAVFGYLFLPNFKDGNDAFRRIDDIWGGYIFQKLLRKLHQSTMVGFPIIYHDTIVDASEDEGDEAAMCKYEDKFIEAVNTVVENMALSVNPAFKGVQMAELMKDFILNWEDSTTVCFSVFKKLTPAFKWWEKVINKYA
jgi:hypothetical protein